MKKIVFLLFLLMPFCVFADDSICSTTIINSIYSIEEELNNCKIDMNNNPSTADMNEATYNSADCIIAVVHKVFDTFYTKRNKQVREDFDKLVVEIYKNCHNISQYSDMVDHATMRNTEAISHANYIFRQIAKDYIQQMKSDCWL